MKDVLRDKMNEYLGDFLCGDVDASEVIERLKDKGFEIVSTAWLDTLLGEHGSERGVILGTDDDMVGIHGSAF